MSAEPRTCPECRLDVAPDFRFCPSCGIPLEPAADLGPIDAAPPAAGPAAAIREAAAPAWIAERRLVSVLFMDLVGFTRMSEQLDPEDVREIQSRYFEAARSSVAHYGGSLEKFIGDAVMAVWGTPIAQENDAERAVRAALEMLRKVAAMATPVSGRLQARAAVTTGEAAVTLDVDGEGMVTGDLVNTASRLQEASPAGTLLVDDATRRAAGDTLRFEEAGQHSLKGKAMPVTAWRVVEGTVDAPDAQPGHGGPFVGRATELHALDEVVTSMVRERRMTVASIVGVAGIGKSRLAWELERTSSGRDGLRWFAGRPPRWGQGTAFAPLTEMLRRSVGVVDGDPSEVVRRAVDAALARLIPDEAEREWMQPRVMMLLDPSSGRDGTPPEGEREELFAAWRRYLEAEAESAPIALLFEDVQWAEAEMLDFLDYLASWSRRRPILIMALSRPELLEARPTWGAGIPHFTSMHLDRLPDEDVDALLRALAPDLPPDTANRVRQRSEGVPLYAVEIVRMLTEGGKAGPGSAAGIGTRPVEIPESLHALLAARIDALPAAERSLLLGAAVLGRRFRPEALAALAGVDRATLGRRLGALLRREFLAVDDDPASPGRGQVSFVQDLVREVAYNTLSRRERRSRHLAVIDYLERSGDPDRIEPMAEHLVAAHAASRADQPEAGVIADRAREALRLAADRAKAMHAPQRALAHLDRALALTAEEAQRADLLESAAAAARAAARFAAAEAHLREAIDLRDSMGDVAASTRHRAQLASLLLQAQRSETALAELESAWQASSQAEGAEPSRHLPAELARAYLLRGENERAIEWAERAISLPGPQSDQGARALAIDARVTLGTAYAQMGRSDEGLAELRLAIDEAAAASLGSVELRARTNLAWLAVSDDPRATSETARRGLELAERLGNREWTLHLLDIATIVAIDTGEWDWASDALESVADGEQPTAYRLDFAATRAIIDALRGRPDALAPVERLGQLEPDLDPQALGWVDISRALVAAFAGERATALQLAQAAARKTAGYERAEALALAGRVAAWMGNHAAASAALRDLEAEPSWGRASEARHRTLRAAVEAVQGSEEPVGAAAQRDWSAAIQTWQELRLPLREALCRLDRFRLAGDSAEGEAAARIFDALGAKALSALARGTPAAAR
jgi:class 3 adenylate cyclase/tetratricopeptide (TPR) repeat protein